MKDGKCLPNTNDKNSPNYVAPDDLISETVAPYPPNPLPYGSAVRSDYPELLGCDFDKNFKCPSGGCPYQVNDNTGNWRWQLNPDNNNQCVPPPAGALGDGTQEHPEPCPMNYKLWEPCPT